MGEEALDAMFPEPNEQAETAEEAPVVESVQVEATEPTPVIEAPAIEAPQVQEDKSVPLATFLDMRDKLKDAERRAAELEAAKPQPKQDVPDPFDNPEAYAAYQRQEVQAAVMGQKFETSDLIARQSHGDETVEAATAWAMDKAKANPAFAAEYMKERHPIDWIVRQHKQEADLTDYRTDPVAFARRILEASGQQIAAPATVTTQPAPKPASPPRSIASDASPTTAAQSDPQAEFMAIFDRK